MSGAAGRSRNTLRNHIATACGRLRARWFANAGGARRGGGDARERNDPWTETRGRIAIKGRRRADSSGAGFSSHGGSAVIASVESKPVVVTRAESADGPLSLELRTLGLPVLLWPAVATEEGDTRQ